MPLPKTTPYKIKYGLTNMFDYYYVGNLFMGDTNEKIRVIWDTGSEWLVIQSYLCQSCNPNYDYNHEGVGSFTRVTNTISSKNYGSA